MGELIREFNPYNQHQDCHEFLVLLLDKLHEEMALLHSDTVDEEESKGAWNEVGAGSTQKRFNNTASSLTQESMVRDIFGGMMRTEFHVEGRKHTNVTFEPFFVLNLEITKCEDLESCLSSFFDQRPLSDYKEEGKLVKAYHQQ